MQIKIIRIAHLTPIIATKLESWTKPSEGVEIERSYLHIGIT